MLDVLMSILNFLKKLWGGLTPDTQKMAKEVFADFFEDIFRRFYAFFKGQAGEA